MWEYQYIWQTAAISVKSIKASLIHHHHDRCLPNRTTYQFTVPAVSITFTVLLFLQLFTPCSATLYHFKLKQFHSSTPLGRVDFVKGHDETGQLHVSRRDVISSHNLTNMTNNLNGLSGDGYYIDVNIGTPPQKMQVLIDTGSANFAVAAWSDPNLSHFFHQEHSSTFSSTGVQIYVPYTEGEWRGVLGTDIVSLPSAQNISATVYIACISQSKAFFITDAEWQGILGLAYAELARPDSSYIPLWDSILLANPDISNVFSMQLCGSSFVHTREKPLMEGTLIIGGVLPSMTKTPLFYTPIYKKWYYEVVLTDIQVAGEQLGMDCKEYNFDKTIVDSGTTNIRLPNKVFDAVVLAIDRHAQYQGNFIGQFFYNGNSVACYTDMSIPFSIFPVVSFFLLQSENSSFKLDITPQHYLRPVENLQGDGVFPDQSCVKFGFSPSSSGTVLGAVLMEAFYVVFDRNMSQIGFGQTTCPLPDPAHPILKLTISGPFSSNKNLSECAYKKPETAEKKFLVVSYVMAALLVVVVLPMMLLFVMWTCKLIRQRKSYGGETSETQAVLSGS